LKRQRINEILAEKRFVLPLWNAVDEEVISQESEDDRLYDEIPLSLPNENNLQKFENDLIVIPLQSLHKVFRIFALEALKEEE